MMDGQVDDESDSRARIPGGNNADDFDRVAEEFAARCRAAESPTIGEYEARFPEYAPLIRRLLPTVAMMEQMKRDSWSGRDDATRPEPPARLGEFRVVREIGRGAMGVVYEAVQESLGRHVALKVIHQAQRDGTRRQRFEREARAIARLDHTNIVPIFGVGEHEGLPYYAMQFIRGITLDALLARWRDENAPSGAERWRFVARVGTQVAEALRYAHEQGVLHRDIKPENLLLDDRQTVWVADFGLAKRAGDENLTATGDVVGTLRYLAPEVLNGQTDARSDVYSLGLTLYELLTLRPPFGELTPSELMHRVSEGELRQPRRLDPRIPRDLETIVLTATAREPRHRYATAGDLADDLARFLEDRPIRARPTTLFHRGWRWVRRRPATAALAGFAAGAFVFAGVIGWSGYVGKISALEQESRRRGASEIAARRAVENVALSLKVFETLFESIASDDDCRPTPFGRGALIPRRDNFDGGVSQPGGRRAAGHHPPPWGPPPPPSSMESMMLLKGALESYEQFAKKNPTSMKLETEAAWAYRKLGTLYDRQGRGREAEGAYARAFAMLDALIVRSPESIEHRVKLVQIATMAEPWSAELDTLDRLEGRLRRARDVVDALVHRATDNPRYALLQAHVWTKLGVVLQRLERPDEAEACLLRAIALDTELIERSPAFGPPRIDRAATREVLAQLAMSRDRRDDAQALLESALTELQALAAWNHVSPAIAGRLESLAGAFDRLGDVDRAAQVYRLAAEESLRRPPKPPGPPGHGPRGLRAISFRP